MNEPRDLNLRIDYGNESSLDLLRPLWLCLHHYHQSIASGLAPYVDDDVSWATRRRFYADCLSHNGSFVLLAYSREDLVAYAFVLVKATSSMWSDTWVVGERTAELETLVVVPEWRGQGIGSLLMDRVESELVRSGIKDIIIGALPTNTDALNLYRRRGFEPTALVMTRFAKRGAQDGYQQAPTRQAPRR
jgi:ribosomal protein S18 acetylase RimI-like enzyme